VIDIFKLNLSKEDLNIVIVDDEAVIVKLITIYLKKAGYKNIKTFTDPILAKKEIISFQPHIVCTDINMPVMDGLELFQSVKVFCEKTVFLMITASSDFTDVLGCLKMGAYDYITKPIKKETLLNSVEKAADIIVLREANEIYIKKLTNQNKLLSNFREKMNLELSLAQELQTKITPSILSEFGDYDIFFKRKFSSKIGGDYIEGYKFKSGDKFAILLADMPGHGIPAALILSVFKVFAYEALRTEKTAAEIMNIINANFSELNINVFPSACCIIIDKKNKCIEYVNAGHPYPFIIHSDRSSTILEENQLLLCVGGSEYKNQYTKLKKGDRFSFYSDGIIEMISRKSENDFSFFSLNGLIDFMCKRNEKKMDEVFEELYKKLIKFHGSDDFEDDIMLCTISLD
jgi:serine phosphatase RsbU (regulator of sigma subunit)